MNIEQHVPSLELCKRMKELGWDRKTIFVWRYQKYPQDIQWGGEAWEVNHEFADGYALTTNTVPAPLASEIGEELPYVIEVENCVYFLYIEKIGKNQWGIQYQDIRMIKSELPIAKFTHDQTYARFIQKSETNARAIMWIYLKECELI